MHMKLQQITGYTKFPSKSHATHGRYRFLIDLIAFFGNKNVKQVLFKTEIVY